MGQNQNFLRFKRIFSHTHLYAKLIDFEEVYLIWIDNFNIFGVGICGKIDIFNVWLMCTEKNVCLWTKLFVWLDMYIVAYGFDE